MKTAPHGTSRLPYCQEHPENAGHGQWPSMGGLCLQCQVDRACMLALIAWIRRWSEKREELERQRTVMRCWTAHPDLLRQLASNPGTIPHSMTQP